MSCGLRVALLGTCMALGGQVLAAAGPLGLYPIKVGAKWGYLDRSGVLRIEPRFKQARDFSEGLAAVDTAGDGKDAGEWGFIDSEGRWAIEPRFQEAKSFAEGLAVVQHGVRRLLIDKEGREAAELRFSTARSLAQGLMVVSTGNLQGYADRSGRLVIPARFSQAWDFTGDGLAGVVMPNRRCGFIDRRGRFVVEPRLRGCYRFAEGLAAVEEDAGKGKAIFIRRDGSQAFPGKFDSARRFSEGLAAACQGGLCGFLDKRGRWAVLPVFERAREFSQGLAEVESGGLWGYCDRSGRLVIPARFNDTVPFKNGLACVKLGERLGYVDGSGRYVWHPLKGFGREVLIAALVLLAAAFLPGAASHWLGARAWSAMRGAESQAKLDILHRLQGRLGVLGLAYALVFLAAGGAIGHFMGGTLEQGFALVQNQAAGLEGRVRDFCLLAVVLGPSMALFFAGYILVQTGGYRADRLARQTRWSVWEAARANLRVMAIMLLPMFLWFCLVTLLGGWLPDNDYALYACLVVFLLSVFTFAPLWLRFLWRAKPLPPDSEVARTLAALSARTGVRFSGAWVWQSSRAKLANAMVSGLLPFCRSVFLTDVLLKNFTPAEIGAVIGHEIGHIKKRHLWFYAAFSAAYGLATGGMFWVVQRPVVASRLSPAAFGVISGFWYLGYFVVLFGVLSRRFELQADLYSAELTGDPRAMASALEKLGRLSGAPRRWSRWLELLSPHPSISRRVDALSSAASRRSKVGMMCFLACVLACSQGCDKEIEKIKLDLFPSSGRGGKAYVPPRRPKGACKGTDCPKIDPPIGQMSAPMQAPPKPRPAAKDPPQGGRLPKPPRAKLISAPAGGSAPAQDQKPGESPAPAQTPPLEKAERPDESPAPRPDEYTVEKADPGSKYLSPAAVRGQKVGTKEVKPQTASPAAAGGSPGAAMVDVDGDAPEVTPLSGAADILGDVAEDSGDIGAHRVQISRAEDFKAVLFDNTYSFIEDADLYREFQQSGLKDGTYFIRYAVVDLLDFQHPYSTPRKFKLRGARLPAPKAYPARRP